MIWQATTAGVTAILVLAAFLPSWRKPNERFEGFPADNPAYLFTSPPTTASDAASAAASAAAKELVDADEGGWWSFWSRRKREELRKAEALRAAKEAKEIRKYSIPSMLRSWWPWEVEQSVEREDSGEAEEESLLNRDIAAEIAVLQSGAEELLSDAAAWFHFLVDLGRRRVAANAALYFSLGVVAPVLAALWKLDAARRRKRERTEKRKKKKDAIGELVDSYFVVSARKEMMERLARFGDLKISAPDIRPSLSDEDKQGKKADFRQEAGEYFSRGLDNIQRRLDLTTGEGDVTLGLKRDVGDVTDAADDDESVSARRDAVKQQGRESSAGNAARFCGNFYFRSADVIGDDVLSSYVDAAAVDAAAADAAPEARDESASGLEDGGHEDESDDDDFDLEGGAALASSNVNSNNENEDSPDDDVDDLMNDDDDNDDVRDENVDDDNDDDDDALTVDHQPLRVEPRLSRDVDASFPENFVALAVVTSAKYCKGGGETFV